MEAVFEEDGFVVGLAVAQTLIEDAEHFRAELAVASGHGIAALLANREIHALPAGGF